MSGTAFAVWTSSSSGISASRATEVEQGNTPEISVSGRGATLSWSETTLANGAPVDEYIVRRFDLAGVEQSTQGSCSDAVSVLTCTESALAAGAWRYTVTPKKANWLGAPSPLSAVVDIASPSISLVPPTTITSLPATITASLSSFVSGQSVTFRLDGASGPVLSSTMTPNSVSLLGTATASITIPDGTSNGPHSIYAVGDQGDVVSAPFTVSVPISQSITSAPYSVRDASSGTEADVSHQFAFASDARTAALSAWGSAYSSTRYIDVNMSSALPSGLDVTNPAFNFRFSSSGNNQTCFYFEVRRASTGAVLGTHGSAASPIACATSTTMVSTSTPLSEVATSAQANDLKIRIYGRNSAGASSVTDLATFSGSTASTGAFTLYAASIGDAASGAAPVTYPWSLETTDSTVYASAASWNTTFSSTRYLKLTYPNYVPSGASAISATFNHSYRSATAGTTSCYYFEVYSGSTLLATHGSAVSPVSCNSSNVTNVTDSVPLPEVDTVSKANNIVIRVYARNNSGTAGSRRTAHDAARVTINFSS